MLEAPGGAGGGTAEVSGCSGGSGWDGVGWGAGAGAGLRTGGCCPQGIVGGCVFCNNTPMGFGGFGFMRHAVPARAPGRCCAAGVVLLMHKPLAVLSVNWMGVAHVSAGCGVPRVC